jgi:peptidoglycan/LPS O-acetylase OafA/YrhL
LLLKAGWSGVSLFFVLSGFLISGILWDTHGTIGWLRNFYVRRALRIFPLYYGSLLLVVLTAVAAHQGLLCLSHIWVFALYLQNFPALARFTSSYGSPLVLGHFWSLAVEEQFYLLWPFLLSRMKTLARAKYLCVATIVVSFCFRWWIWSWHEAPPDFYGFLLTHAGELAAGGFLAMCYRDGSWKRVDRLAPIAAAGSLAGFAAAGWWSGSLEFQRPGIIVYGLIFLTILWASVLVLSLRLTGFWSRAMNLGWLRVVGKISYGIYVFHVLFHPVYVWVAEKILLHADRIQSLALNGVVTVVGSFSVAWLSFRFYESFFLRLRKRFSGKRHEETLAA